MHILALIVGILALISFGIAAFADRDHARVRWGWLGGLLLTLMLILQFTLESSDPITL